MAGYVNEMGFPRNESLGIRRLPRDADADGALVFLIAPSSRSKCVAAAFCCHEGGHNELD